MAALLVLAVRATLSATAGDTVLSQLCRGTKLGEPEPVPGVLTQNSSPAASAPDVVLGTAFHWGCLL